MQLSNVTILGQEGLKDIFIKDGIIQSAGSYESYKNEDEKDISLTFSDALAFPGLINSHDHLDFNLFPPVKNRIYNNYAEWGKDIHENNKQEITKVLKVPLHVRVQWGIYKNLLNGFTTVVNHGAHLKIEDEIINVFQKSHSIHSVAFEKNWKWKINNPFKNKWPFAAHVGEGKDKASHEEISRLIQWNFLKRKIIGIHGVAMDQDQAEHLHALVWCPASNYFLLNKTAAIDFLKDKTNILFGSDSTLTSPWNIWEHIRLARNEKMLNDHELIESMTTKPASVWGLDGQGKIEKNKHANIVIAKRKKNLNDYDNFFSLNPEDVLMVTHRGNIRLFDDEIKNQIDEKNIQQNNFSKININGSIKFVQGNLPLLTDKIKKYYPEAEFPFSIVN